MSLNTTQMTTVLNVLTTFLNKREAFTVENVVAAIEKQEDVLKQSILEEMENKGILSLKDETVGLSISYIASTERETLDSKRLRDEKPDTYDEYVKFTPVKSSIRIKVE